MYHGHTFCALEAPPIKANSIQVKSNPIQKGGVNCGIYAALQAEAFCALADGSFTIAGAGGPDAKVTCEGSSAEFLMDPGVWCTEEDVALARLTLNAATHSVWLKRTPTWQPTEDRERIRASSESAWQALLAKTNDSLPARDHLWYATLTLRV